MPLEGKDSGSIRKSGRVVYAYSPENYRTARFREFESHLFRQNSMDGVVARS